MGSKFCVKFQRVPLKFHTKFWTHTPQNMHSTVFYFCVWVTISLNCDVISLSETGPRSLFNIPNGFTVKHKRSARILYRCDTNRAGHFTFDAYASRSVACLKRAPKGAPCSSLKSGHRVYIVSLTLENFNHALSSCMQSCVILDIDISATGEQPIRASEQCLPRYQ